MNKELLHTTTTYMGEDWWEGDKLVKVIAGVDDMREWAAYVENDTTREFGNSPEDIYAYGTKLPSRYAEPLFPMLAGKLRYRR